MRTLALCAFVACAHAATSSAPIASPAISLQYQRGDDAGGGSAIELEPCPSTWTNDLEVGCALVEAPCASLTITTASSAPSPCNRTVPPEFLGGEDRMPVTYWPARVGDSSDGSIVFVPRVEAR